MFGRSRALLSRLGSGFRSVQALRPLLQKASFSCVPKSEGPKAECISNDAKPSSLEEIYELVESGKWKFFSLEKNLGDFQKAAEARRHIVAKQTGRTLTGLPCANFDYSSVQGQCCENVVGYVQIPVGVAGPLLVDGKKYYVPLATTEGALVASTTRGAKVLTSSGGVKTELFEDGMTRAPVLEVPNLATAVRLRNWIQKNFDKLVIACNGTSNYAQLKQIKTFFAGRKVFLRFKCTTGDAMGMNMVTKGVEKCMSLIHEAFPEVRCLGLSGNVCTDKKPSSVNWTDGRGKSVGAECVIPGSTVSEVLKTSVKAMVELNYAKNFMGSALAGSIGGNNAHAANLVAALYLATGQDIAQTVDSCMCMTTMEAVNDGQDLYVSVNMPTVEVGTVGGGTGLQGQAACLNLLGVRGPHPQKPGANATQLARLVAATVMAGELSLMAAISAGHLNKSHMALNRKSYLTAATYSKNSAAAAGHADGNRFFSTKTPTAPSVPKTPVSPSPVRT